MCAKDTRRIERQVKVKLVRFHFLQKRMDVRLAALANGYRRVEQFAMVYNDGRWVGVSTAECNT